MSTEKNFAALRAGLSPERRAKVDATKASILRDASMFRAIRESLKLTQVEAARRLLSSQANVSKLEKRSTADLGQISKLAGDDYDVVVVLRPKAKHALEELEFAVS